MGSNGENCASLRQQRRVAIGFGGNEHRRIVALERVAERELQVVEVGVTRRPPVAVPKSVNLAW